MKNQMAIVSAITLILTISISLPSFAGSNIKKSWKHPGAHGAKTKSGGQADKAISGTIKLDSKVIKKLGATKKLEFTDRDVLFVIARQHGKPMGPPIAVIRVGSMKGKKFPVTFQIGPENVMMGDASSFRGPFTLKAKLSRTGDASTSPGDVIGTLSHADGIKGGSQKVEIILSTVVN